MSRLEVPRGGGPGSKLGAGCRQQWVCSGRSLFHAAAQHLVGRDEHHTDDEGDGEGADQALAHARLADLLVGTGCSRPPGTSGKETKGDSGGMESDLHSGTGTPGWDKERGPYANPWHVPLPELWNPPTETQGRPLTLHVHGTLLRCAQVALLFRHDDVLYVLHGQVFAEGVIEKSLQLVHCQLLHVTLGWQRAQVFWLLPCHSPHPAPCKSTAPMAGLWIP